MSRCYRIEVAESLRKHIQVDDGIAIHLELLDILPQDRMRALLEHQLSKKGYEKQDDGTYTKELDGGIQVAVSPEGEVTISLSDEAELELEAKRTGRSYSPNDSQATQRLRSQVEADLQADEDAATEKLRKEVTKRLESALESLRSELDDAVNRATAEALKEKARQLGEVQEISEDPETGAVTIRVKV